jgi:SmpA / OmlA family
MWGWIAVVVLLYVTVGGVGAWWLWPGCFSKANYDRIQPGMSRDQVAALLGSPGRETKSIPHHPPYHQKPGYPPGWTGAVWGDTFIHWQDGYKDIYVGFADGQVTSKFYWEPSL